MDHFDENLFSEVWLAPVQLNLSYLFSTRLHRSACQTVRRKEKILASAGRRTDNFILTLLDDLGFEGEKVIFTNEIDW